MPVIRLEHVTRIFAGGTDEETRALDDVTKRHIHLFDGRVVA